MTNNSKHPLMRPWNHVKRGWRNNFYYIDGYAPINKADSKSSINVIIEEIPSASVQRFRVLIDASEYSENEIKSAFGFSVADVFENQINIIDSPERKSNISRLVDLFKENS